MKLWHLLVVVGAGFFIFGSVSQYSDTTKGVLILGGAILFVLGILLSYRK